MLAKRARIQVPLLALGIVIGLAAMWAGLARIGWQLPLAPAELILAHGPLMVGGFLGTLIGLERAVALRRPWSYLAPVSAGAAALWLIAAGPNPASAGLYALSALVVCLMFVRMLRQHRELFVATLLAGAVLWLAGNLLWAAGQPIFRVVFWWAGFLVLTIAGERLELARLARISGGRVALFAGAIVLYVIGIVLSTVAPEVGVRIAGAGQIALAGWHLAFDIARRTIRQSGLPRYIAVCLMAGYGWLAASGVMAAAFGPVIAGPQYDAILHALFVGFVISMIFGHGPIIFPSVLGRMLAYRPLFYGPLVILHLSVILRIAGDLAALQMLRQIGGLLNAIAVLLFAGCMIYGLRFGAREGRA